jgi:hypothetical protein
VHTGHGVMVRECRSAITEPKICDTSSFNRAVKRTADRVIISERKQTTIEAGRKRAQRIKGGVVQRNVARLAVLGVARLASRFFDAPRQIQDFIPTHPGI